VLEFHNQGGAVKKNIFILGDLVVDHDVIVRLSDAMHGSGEGRYDVVRRQDTAGAAANSARILAVLNDGTTSLWGIVGRSNWGSFREVLEASHAIDGAASMVELRGIHDDTDPPIDTVTRLLILKNGDPYDLQRGIRFYDTGKAHITDAKRRTVLDHLDRAHHKNRLDAIIINDFDKKCVTKELVTAISEFAHRFGIPLFIDPRFDRSKYEGIRATAILPNLAEWCYLVDDRDGADRWRANLYKRDTLIEMAERSFKYLGNFEHYVIKCDVDGAVLISPHPTKRHLYAVYRVPPAPTRGDLPAEQVGCGDVMTAVFAGEYDSANPTTASTLFAFQRANATVAAYREMPWHRMPSRTAVTARQQQHSERNLTPDAEVSKSPLLLPSKRDRIIEMRSVQTLIRGLYSQDNAFCDVITALTEDVSMQWQAGALRSIILGAAPGSGKSTILAGIKEVGRQHMVHVVDLTGKLQELSNVDLDQYFVEQINRLPITGQRLLMVVDEARKIADEVSLSRWGVNLLNFAHDRNVRFLFVDAGFTREIEADAKWQEFTGRCRPYFLPSLEDRPADIPYIVAGRLFERGRSWGLRVLTIDESVLLGLIEKALQCPDPRALCTSVDQVYDAAEKKRRDGEESLFISSEDLKIHFQRRPVVHRAEPRYFQFLK
jgi:sugar/nucleoside kinase (ribokinase family)